MQYTLDAGAALLSCSAGCIFETIFHRNHVFKGTEGILLPAMTTAISNMPEHD
jgi:hypothetical protein